MGIRYYMSDLLAPDVDHAYWRLAVADAQPAVSYAACLLEGQLWGLAYCKASDWTGVAADARNFRLFQGIDDGPSLAALLDALRTTTVGDVPLARRNAVSSKMDSVGVPTADITLGMTLLTVLRKVGRALGLGYNEARVFVEAGV